MMSNFFLVLLMIGAIMAGACTKQRTDDPGKPTIHNSGPKVQGKEHAGMIDVLKRQKLAGYDSMTIGNAFDAYQYLTKKEWKQASLKSGQTTIDFIGWYDTGIIDERAVKKGIKGKGIGATFVIDPNGSYYVLMVSSLELRADGSIYGSQLADTKGILAKIYANKKISF